MSTAPSVSVGVALYNEEAVLPELLERLSRVLGALPGTGHQVVLVDDGSVDRTWSIIEAAAQRDPRIVAISLSRNFGHQAALTAVLEHVTGDVTIIMDGDLQDPPEEIPRFLAAYATGADVVYAKRVNRKEGVLLRLSYHAFYRLVGSLASVQLPTDAGDFGLLSRRVVNELRRTREHHRYLRGLRTWVGFRQEGIEVERGERFAGDSKYSASKLFKLAFDGIFAFSIVPLRAAAFLGAIAVGLTALFSIYSLYAKLFLNRSPQGFTAIILVITFLSGVHLFFLGVIGEYVGRVYEEVKGRPIYIIGKLVRNGDGS
jgi:polyisoprenyl-phosphate glycosyltransferase